MKPIALLIPLLFLFSCGRAFESEFADAVVYETRHFRIHYHESSFLTEKVEIFAGRKEKLLDRINQLIGENFDGKIDTYLYPTGTTSYAYGRENKIEETYLYIIKDSGHEIAHIVTISKMGRCRSNFMVEGLAVMLECNTTDPITALENRMTDGGCYFDLQGEPRSNAISKQLLNNSFSYSTFDYVQAGAFLYYLYITYGVDKVKLFYMKGCNAPYNGYAQFFSDSFRAVFGTTLEDAEKDFIYTYIYARNGRYEYCTR